ncbi:HAMP domain-containing sensor histidine kinase [Streptomyces sp. NPDC048266]|uniref:sensor histidine kinase n=1 Tax=Streptomyces sp. NPDC048266 TaxID=3155787 RepID=UPI0033C07F9D
MAMLSRRLSIRLRAALAAALTAALAFTAGAWWLRHELYASEMFTARERARASLDVLVPRYTGGTTDAPVFSNPSEMWVLVDSAGRMVDGNPALTPSVPGPLGPRTPEPDTLTFFEETVHLGAVPNAQPSSKRLADRDYTMLTAAFHGTGLPDDNGTASATQLTLHILVTPWEAEQAVASIDHTLYIGVPAAVLLVALIVWTTTTRALRPVEKIQQRLRTITAQNLSQRVPVPPRRDEITRLAATTNDALDRLEQAVEQQRRFTADASHELRTPMAALRADLEVALHYPDRTEWSQVIRDTLGDTERLQQLTEDLLLLADLDHHTPPPAHPVQLGPLAYAAIAQCRRHAPGSVRIDCHTIDDVAVHGDAPQLERLLRNLLDNAVRHARSRVTVTVTANTATAKIEVQDDGSGIPAEHREKIFERFARLDASRNRTTGGTGLGLALAREIAHRHGGTLTHSNTPTVTGAHFIAKLPLSPTTEPVGPAADHSALWIPRINDPFGSKVGNGRRDGPDARPVLRTRSRSSCVGPLGMVCEGFSVVTNPQAPPRATLTRSNTMPARAARSSPARPAARVARLAKLLRVLTPADCGPGQPWRSGTPAPAAPNPRHVFAVLQ